MAAVTAILVVTAVNIVADGAADQATNQGACHAAREFVVAALAFARRVLQRIPIPHLCRSCFRNRQSQKGCGSGEKRYFHHRMSPFWQARCRQTKSQHRKANLNRT
jgi:hypothetical protein